MRPHLPANPNGSIYFEPSRVLHKYWAGCSHFGVWQPKKIKTSHTHKQYGGGWNDRTDLTIDRPQPTLNKLSSYLVTAFYSSLMSPIYILDVLSNVLFKGIRRIPLVIWILLIPMIIIPPQSVMGMPDTTVPNPRNSAVFVTA